ncbi:unnamed protein product, partial [Timema podura]|nr:unnamed protein product [Timema podura]
PSRQQELSGKSLQESRSLPSQGLSESKSLQSKGLQELTIPGPSREPTIQGPPREQELTVPEPLRLQELTVPEPLREQELTESRNLLSQGLQENKSLPSQDLQESKSLRSKGCQSNKSLPSQSLQESRGLPSQGLQESNSLPSMGTKERYTFFVPTDKAFEKAELSTRPDNFLSKGEGLQILLNHFVKGRLYSKDLTEGKQLHTLGDKVISGEIMVNNANILESEIFVYNLGTMYYIDRVLFVDKMQPTESNPLLEVAHEWTTEIPDDVEGIPSEIADERGGLPDLLEEEEQGYNSTAHYHEENDLEDEPEEYDDINYNHPETISHKINSTGLIQDDPEDYDGNVTTTIRPPR